VEIEFRSERSNMCGLGAQICRACYAASLKRQAAGWLVGCVGFYFSGCLRLGRG
jgi:hypothetical protein